MNEHTMKYCCRKYSVTVNSHAGAPESIRFGGLRALNCITSSNSNSFLAIIALSINLSNAASVRSDEIMAHVALTASRPLLAVIFIDCKTASNGQRAGMQLGQPCPRQKNITLAELRMQTACFDATCLI